MENIRTRASFEYRIPVERLKQKFPQIEGRVIGAEYDNRGENSIVIRTELGYYMDEQMKIWKELGDTEDKDIFVALHLKTKLSAEGKTEEEAKKNLVEKVKKHYDEEEKKKDGKQI